VKERSERTCGVVGGGDSESRVGVRKKCVGAGKSSAIDTRIARRTSARVAVDAIRAGFAASARIGGAFIDVGLTMSTWRKSKDKIKEQKRGRFVNSSPEKPVPVQSQR
jgi:hypothetical protein